LPGGDRDDDGTMTVMTRRAMTRRTMTGRMPGVTDEAHDDRGGAVTQHCTLPSSMPALCLAALISMLFDCRLVC
jgi:hypothetical protein